MTGVQTCALPICFVQPLTRPSTFSLTGRTFRTFKNIPPKNNLTTALVPKRAFNAASVAPTGAKYSINYLIGGAAALGLVGLGALNYLNDDSNSPSYVQARIRNTYLYLGGSLAVTAVAAKAFFNSGLAYRMAAMNPWLLFGVSFAGIIGTNMITHMIPYEDTIPKHLALGAFCCAVAASLCPVVAVGGELLLQAAAATGTIVGSLSFVSAISPEGTYSGLSSYLSIGLGAVIAASLGTIAFPASGLLYGLAVYGGTAVFSIFVLFDTQKILENSKYSPKYDPINNCLGIYMSTINIFINMVNILSNNRKK